MIAKTNSAAGRLSPADGSVIAIPRTDAAIRVAENNSQLVHNLATLSAELERERDELFGALLKARMLLAHINLFISHDDPLYAAVMEYFVSDSQNT